MVGFDIERHVYGEHRYPAQLVLQDILMIHGRQFKDAALIVASPPCQEYSYMAMPWSKAKEKARRLREDAEDRKRLTALFDACFRIQREACEAAGRHIPMVVENVRGAQPWVGRSRWNFGSFHLWGDVPALMPITVRGRMKAPVTHRPGDAPFLDFRGQKVPGFGVKVATMGADWYPPGHPKHVRGLGFNTHAERALREGVKQPGSGRAWFDNGICKESSKSNARKAASAAIAKIPLVLARHVARAWFPAERQRG